MREIVEMIESTLIDISVQKLLEIMATISQHRHMTIVIKIIMIQTSLMEIM